MHINNAIKRHKYRFEHECSKAKYSKEKRMKKENLVDKRTFYNKKQRKLQGAIN